MTPLAVTPGPALIGLGLAAWAFWGASDFLGGLATRKAHVVLVVALGPRPEPGAIAATRVGHPLSRST